MIHYPPLSTRWRRPEAATRYAVVINMLVGGGRGRINPYSDQR
jgi:hypothetical protein